MNLIQQKTFVIRGVIIAAGIGVMFQLSPTALAAVSADDRMMFDQGRYQPLLVQLNQELASKKTPAADRYDLLMFKGETLLRSKASGGAVEAFTAAAAVGADDNAIAVARGTASLIKHSGPGKYQPKAKAGSKDLPAAIDIVDPTSRKSAFVAYFADLLTTLQPQVDRAATMTSLTPIMALAKQVGDARNVEVAGTGADAQSKDLLTKLATRAGDLMNAIIKPLDQQITTVTKDAETRQKKMGKREPANSFASLSLDDSNELDNIVSSAEQVEAAAAQMVPIFGDIGDFKTIQTDAQKLVTDANKILKQYKHPTAS